MKLTARDKALLTVVLLVVVWAVGIIFIIKPKFEERTLKKDELVNVEANLVTVRAEEAAAKTIKDDCNTALKEAQDGAKNFFDVPKDYEAERYLAAVLAGAANGDGRVNINSLSITGPTAVSLVSYDPEERAEINVPINDAANIAGTTNIDLSTSLLAAETLGCYNFTVSFEAYREDLMQFLTNIKTTENGNSLVVTALNISDNTVPNDEVIEGTMSFSLYFVRKLEGENVDEIIEAQTAAAEGEAKTE